MPAIQLAITAVALWSSAGRTEHVQAALVAKDTIRVQVVSEPKNPWVEPSALFGVLGILGGVAGVLLQRFWHRRDSERAAERAERDRVQAHVLDSLKWFEGKSQKRSIGIAVVEGNWARFPDLHSTWAAVLVNQAVYLLAESGQDDAKHEIDNFYRIQTLLNQPDANMTSLQKQAIAAAITRNAAGDGLKGLNRKMLEDWRSALSAAA